MAAREGGGHPFNWFLIGFVVGVAVTLGALLFLDAKHDSRSVEEREPSASEPAPAAAPPSVTPPAVAYVPPAPRKTVIPKDDRPHVSQREADDQVAEDAAAAGMTSRTNPGQASSDGQH